MPLPIIYYPTHDLFYILKFHFVLLKNIYLAHIRFNLHKKKSAAKNNMNITGLMVSKIFSTFLSLTFYVLSLRDTDAFILHHGNLKV